MNRLFDIEGPLFTTLTRIADLFILNFLFIVCCLPVFTIGASVSALYYVTMKMAANEDCYTVKSFFKAFKENFKKSTVIWIIDAFVGISLFIDYKIIRGDYGKIFNPESKFTNAMFILFILASIIWIYVTLYVYPIQAKFENTIKNTIVNALYMSILNLPKTLLIVVMTAFPWVIMYYVERAVVFYVIVFSVVAYMNSFIFVRIFRVYENKVEITKDENFTVQFDDTDTEKSKKE